MINLDSFYTFLEDENLSKFCEKLRPKISSYSSHGDFEKWLSISRSIPSINPSVVDFNSDVVKIGSSIDLDETTKKSLKQSLQKFSPWRKGPYSLFDIFIDTEWRSDWKWNRLKDFIAPLDGKNVIDIGCGNGYHCWRMIGSGAKNVIGIDPYLLSSVQFNTIKKITPDLPVWIIPVGIDDFLISEFKKREKLKIFDTVFSMGLLYHRKSPFDFLADLKTLLKPGGELVLETLVIEGKENEVLVPQDRYAKMRNVWFIPTPKTLHLWLQRAGYKNIRLIDVNKTSIEEQRRTEWIDYESLADFLDKENPHLTIEGYPAPRRAIFIASI